MALGVMTRMPFLGFVDTVGKVLQPTFSRLDFPFIQEHVEALCFEVIGQDFYPGFAVAFVADISVVGFIIVFHGKIIK
jgi:hypothetical protein